MIGIRIGFLLWTLCGSFIIGLGISAFFSKKAMYFWANTDPVPVRNIKAYNRAVGKLWITYGIIFMLLGLPMLGGQNTVYILLSVLGVVIETIAVMAIYSLYITKKYSEK